MCSWGTVCNSANIRPVAELKRDKQMCREVLLGYLNRIGQDRIILGTCDGESQSELCIKRQVCITQKIVTPVVLAKAWEHAYDRTALQCIVGVDLAIVNFVRTWLLSRIKSLTTVVREYGDVVG